MGITARDVTLAEAIALPRIPSSYETAETFELRRCAHGQALTWTMARIRLPAPVRTIHDDGDIHDWIETYAQEPGLGRLRFIAAEVDGRHAGLLTWAHVDWNETLWLVDIRVHSELRRRGVGGMLVDALLPHTRPMSVRGIHVETQIRNVPAIDFYGSRGFLFSGFNEHLYSNAGLEEQDVAIYLFLSTVQAE